AYLALYDRSTLGQLGWLIGAFTLAAISDWPAFILVPVLTAHWVTTRPAREWRWIIGFGAVACGILVLLSGYIGWATQAHWNWMLPLFERRSAIGMTAPFTARQWLATAMAFNRRLHTWPMLIAAGLGLLVPARSATPPQRGATVARLLVAWGVLHVVI